MSPAPTPCACAEAGGRAAWKKSVRWLRTFQGAALLLTVFTGLAAWGFWKFDITSGDTASYFAMASTWKLKGAFPSADPMAYSPLYTVYYAWCQRVFPDAGAATALHRLLIVLAAGWGTLAALRQMMPRGWAWLTAAWWIAINWHAIFEVHLFGYAVLIIAAACVGAGRSPWWRGVGLALLGADAVLVRNELLPAVVLFGLGCVLVGPWREWWRRLPPLVVPSLLLGLGLVWLYSGNAEQLNLAKLRQAHEARQQSNLRQVYLFGYRQRHPEWQGDPWQGGAEVMQQQFGEPNPSMARGFALAPRAMLEHVLWNLRLVPAGLQEGIFGCYSGPVPPDFSPSRDPGLADPLVPSLVLLGALLGGGWLLWQRHRARKPFFLAGTPGLWTWGLLASTIPSSLLAIVSQRPRPQYIFPLTLLVLAFAALSGRLLIKAAQRRWHLPVRYPRWLPVLASGGLTALLMAMAPHRLPSESTPQPLLEDYHRLSALRTATGRPQRVFCANTKDASDLACYLDDGQRGRWQVVSWAAVAAAAGSNAALETALTEAGVTDFYFRADGLARSSSASPSPLVLAEPWQQIARVQNGSGSWQYWTIPPTANTAKTESR